MHPDLHHFLARFIGTVALALAPVVFTAFVSMPLNLHRHPHEQGKAAKTLTAVKARWQPSSMTVLPR